MRELIPGVFSWSWFSAPHGYDFNGFLVRRPEGNICIDPVPPTDDDAAAIVLGGARVIVLTNRNHGRHANWVRQRTGAPILIHPADAPHAREQGIHVDGALAPGQMVGPLRVVPVPGKSPGEVVLHWAARRALFVGDAVIGRPAPRGHSSSLALLRDAVMDDPALLRQSVRALLPLAPEQLFLADGTPHCLSAMGALQRLVAEFDA